MDKHISSQLMYEAKAIIFNNLVGFVLDFFFNLN